ncbi:MAG: hypothetical protein DRQ89_12085 [Epsilonproteobacteria bacterium]|nr:MAG: hypothetical protein DRQ89_12085 [Campylobacterota bacterium]
MVEEWAISESFLVTFEENIQLMKKVVLPIAGIVLILSIIQLNKFDSNTNDSRKKHEQFLLSTYQGDLSNIGINEETNPKVTRPDLAALQNFHMTVDPELQRVPAERLQSALKYVSSSKASNSSAFSKSNNEWTATNSNMGGRIRGIMWDPNDESGNKVWACAVTGGLWYNNNITSENSGWESVSDLWPNLTTSSITYDPNNTETFYLGTGEYHTARVTYRESSGVGMGIWKSTDSGETWELLESTSDFKYISDIKVRNEDGASVIYAGVVSGVYHGEHLSEPTEGLYRSEDGGETWEQVLPNISGFDVPYAPADLEISESGRIFVGTLKNEDGNGGATILYSDNGTTGSWNVFDDYEAIIEADGSTPIPGRVVLAAAPSNPDIVYAVVGAGWINGSGFNLAEGYAILKSTDGGENWDETNFPENQFASLSWHAFSITVNPTDPDMVYIGGLDLWRTINGGDFWSKISNWALMYSGGGNKYLHADQHWTLFKPGSSTEAIFSTDGGVFYTSNATGSMFFSERSKNLNTLQFYSCDVNPDTSKNDFIGGLQDNGSLLYTGNPLHLNDMVSGGDGAYCFFDKDDPEYMVTSVYYNQYKFFVGYMGNSSINTQDGVFINPADYDFYMNTLYANSCSFSGYLANSITRIENVPFNSNSYERIELNTNLESYFSHVKYSDYSPDGKTTLFLGSVNGRLFKITEAHGSPETIEIGSDDFPVAYISCIAIGGSEDTLLVTFSNYGVASVWETYNGGETWNDVSGNLPDMPVRWAIYHPDGSNQVMLATELGVWTTTNTSAGIWENDEGLPLVRVDMLKLRDADHTVLAATHGRGMQWTNWEYDLTTGVNEIAESGFSIYPNPSRGQVNINFEDNAPKRIKVYDLNGKLVLNRTFENKLNQIDLSGQPKGVYFVSINDSGKWRAEKLILE